MNACQLTVQSLARLDQPPTSRPPTCAEPSNSVMESEWPATACDGCFLIRAPPKMAAPRKIPAEIAKAKVNPLSLQFWGHHPRVSLVGRQVASGGLSSEGREKRHT